MVKPITFNTNHLINHSTRKLSNLQSGEVGEIVNFKITNKPLQQRLLSLGIVPNNIGRIEVLQNQKKFLIVRVFRTIYAMNKGITDGIFVNVIHSEEKTKLMTNKHFSRTLQQFIPNCKRFIINTIKILF